MARQSKNEAEVLTDPDFTRMKRVFLKDIMPLSEKGSKLRGDMSTAWKAIEQDCRCNKKAAKLLLWLNTQSEETRDDFLRTLYGGMKELNIGISEDLVDAMENGDADHGGVGMPTVKGGGLGAEHLASLN